MVKGDSLPASTEFFENRATGDTQYDPEDLPVATPVHFHNLILGRPACLPDEGRASPISTCDPGQVTCPECLRYLRHEVRCGAPLITAAANDSDVEK